VDISLSVSCLALFTSLTTSDTLTHCAQSSKAVKVSPDALVNGADAAPDADADAAPDDDADAAPDDDADADAAPAATTKPRTKVAKKPVSARCRIRNSNPISTLGCIRTSVRYIICDSLFRSSRIRSLSLSGCVTECTCTLGGELTTKGVTAQVAPKPAAAAAAAGPSREQRMTKRDAPKLAGGILTHSSSREFDLR